MATAMAQNICPWSQHLLNNLQRFLSITIGRLSNTFWNNPKTATDYSDSDLSFKFASTHIAHYPAQESWGRETRNHAFGLMSDARTITFDYAAFAIVESRELLVAEVEVLYF
jgi:hypothetical protein